MWNEQQHKLDNEKFLKIEKLLKLWERESDRDREWKKESESVVIKNIPIYPYLKRVKRKISFLLLSNNS